MTSDKQGKESESLGQFLTRTRIEQGYDFNQIVEDTRISASNLTAMESDDYAALPADAFSRGFYTLLAKKLHLDPEVIVARYRAERGLNPRKGGAVVSHNPPAHKAAKQVSSMAEPSAVSPLSSVGYVLLLLIIVAGGLCWYFGINPATYISERLRALQDGFPQATEQKSGGTPASGSSGNQGFVAPVSRSESRSLGATPQGRMAPPYLG